MSLAQLPTLLLVPPLNCLLAACAGAVLHRRRVGRVLLAAGLAGLVLLSLPIVSGWLLASLEGGLGVRADLADPPAAIVILSGDLVEVRMAGADSYDVGHLTLERERAGARLARGTGLPVLVSGGRIRAGAPSLAALMASSMAADFARPVVWQEDRSQDTWQNAAFSAEILHRAGIGSVFVVTHAWHMRRALMAFHAAGLHATAVPVDAALPPRFSLDGLVPRAAAWEESYFALHEWLGCAWYALRA